MGAEIFTRKQQALQDALDKDVGLLKEENKVAADLGLTFSSAFEDAIVEGKKLSEMLKGLYQDVLRIIVRTTVTQPLANAITGWLGGIGVGTGATAARAMGGPVMPGGAYLVGERGPELFAPRTAGNIVPSSALGAQYFIDARGADAGQIKRLEAMIVQLNGTFEHRAVSAVHNAAMTSRKFAFS
jgi:hypothetical protein